MWAKVLPYMQKPISNKGMHCRTNWHVGIRPNPKSILILDKLLDSDETEGEKITAFLGRCRGTYIWKETRVNRALYIATEIQFSESLEDT